MKPNADNSRQPELKEQQRADSLLVCGTCGLPASTECICAQIPSDEQNSSALLQSRLAEGSYSIDDARNILGERFEVIELLGQGGMGTVFKVRDTNIDAILAVKILNSSLMQDKNSVKRFQREAKAAMSLSDAHLAAVYEYGVGKGAPFLVMDYLEGDTLDSLLNSQGYFDQNRAVNLFVQICEGLAQAHQKGVIHRDVKPSNVIITRPGTTTEFAKIFDFGIAKVLPDQALDFTQDTTKTGELFGSPLYMAPEQCRGIQADQRTDIHALGCLMYKTVTGHHPFEGKNFLETVVKIVTTDPLSMRQAYPEANISAPLEQVILHCLEKDPDNRYQTMDALRNDLEKILDGKPILLKGVAGTTKHHSIPPPSLTNVYRPAPQRPVTDLFRTWFKALAWSCIIVCCVFLALFAVPRPQSSSGVSDPYADAERLDALSYNYFSQGDYERAIPLLEFGVKTYKKNGTKVTGGGLGREDNYLAENLSHLGKCYFKLKNYPKAIANYREALKMFKQWGNYFGGGMTECVNDYAATLRAVGRSKDADRMLAEYKNLNNLNKIP